MSIPYSANIRFFEILERAKSQVTEIKIYRDNAQVVPASATYTLQKPDGTKIKENVAAAVALSGTVSFTHSAGDLPATLNLGEGYMQIWSITISGVVYAFRRMCSLVLKKLMPVISDNDLTAVYTNLEDLRPSSITSFQKYIDDAWYTILRKIRAQAGALEYLVTSPSALYECHRDLSLYLIFRDFHSSLGQASGRYLDLANEHNQAFHAAFNSINWIYDNDHDDVPDDANTRTRGPSTIFTSRGGSYARRRILRR